MALVQLVEKTTSGREYRVKDISLANYGRFVIKLAEPQLPSLMSFRKLCPLQPLKNIRITGSLNLNAHSAVLVETLTSLGADVRLCSCNILSTQDHVAAAIASDSAAVFAWKGETLQEYLWGIERALDWGPDGGPDLLIDDGGDALLLINEGVKAEEEFQKTGKIPDPVLANNPIMIGLIRDCLPIDPNKYHKMKDCLIGVLEETVTTVKMLYHMYAEETFKALSFPPFSVKGNDIFTNSKESWEYVSIGSCFGCGDPNHWKEECPWKSHPCPKATCLGQMKILTSKQDHNFGRKFLRCKKPGCSGFKWLDDAIPTEKNEGIPETRKVKEMNRMIAVTKNEVKISFKGNAEDVCKLINKLGL